MTNAAAIGYMIIAARMLGYTESQIKILEQEMKEEMDVTTEEEAEEAYRNT